MANEQNLRPFTSEQSREAAKKNGGAQPDQPEPTEKAWRRKAPELTASRNRHPDKKQTKQHRNGTHLNNLS